MRAILALEDGRIFEGESFGATGTRVGEVCFNTSMTGYQEVLTDPSYRGQIVAMTYPLIGNYGTNAARPGKPQAARPRLRHRRAQPDPEQLAFGSCRSKIISAWNIPGVQGIDTRALTRHLRERGAMKACLTTEALSEKEAVDQASKGEGVIGMDYIREVTTAAPYQWDPGDRLSATWAVASGSMEEVVSRSASAGALPRRCL